MATGKGSVNRVTLIGNLGTDPELAHTQNNIAVTNLSLATNEVWKDSDGNRQERTEWHKIVLWKQLAEFACEHLGKGSKIYVEGSLRTRSWEDKDGSKNNNTEVYANRVVMLGSRREDALGESEIAEPAEENLSFISEKIPDKN